MGKIILGSASPRRRELLTQIGIEFEIMVSDKEERITAEDPVEICMHLAMQKALDVRDKLRAQGFERGDDRPTRSEEIKLGEGMPLISNIQGQTEKQFEEIKLGGGIPTEDEYTVIGADTIVVLERQILGKPKCREHAAQMLRSLSGREHQVYTGVCVVRGDTTATFAEKTDVYVAPLSEADIRAYIATGDPMDKAGAYGIQGIFAKHIEKIDGDYFKFREYLQSTSRRSTATTSTWSGFRSGGCGESIWQSILFCEYCFDRACKISEVRQKRNILLLTDN